MTKYEHKTTVQVLVNASSAAADDWTPRSPPVDPIPPKGDGWHIVGVHGFIYAGQSVAAIVWEREDPRQMVFK